MKNSKWADRIDATDQNIFLIGLTARSIRGDLDGIEARLAAIERHLLDSSHIMALQGAAHYEDVSAELLDDEFEPLRRSA